VTPNSFARSVPGGVSQFKGFQATVPAFNSAAKSPDHRQEFICFFRSPGPDAWGCGFVQQK